MKEILSAINAAKKPNQIIAIIAVVALLTMAGVSIHAMDLVANHPPVVHTTPETKPIPVDKTKKRRPHAVPAQPGNGGQCRQSADLQISRSAEI